MGPKIAAVAGWLGKPLMPHQRYIADVAGEIDPATGLLAYSEVVLIGPRQATGKTELLLPVMAHRCLGFEHAGPQSVLYTTQTADKAREKWRDVHLARLRASRAPALRGKFTWRLQRNSEAIMWRNGSMWSPGSTTGKTGGTGDTLDVGVIDEAWSRPDARTELGMRPAMMTRDWRQLWIASMIPGLSRAAPGTWPYLRHKRQVGRARVEADVRHGMAFFDFAAPPGLDPADPATWWLAMPGLGRTVSERVVAADYTAMADTATGLVDFEAEYLGWEPMDTTPRWTLIRKETWQARQDLGSYIEGRPALSVEINEDRTRAWINAAGRRPDGHWHVEVLEPGYKIAAGVAGIGWVEPRLWEIVEDHKPWTVALDPRRPAVSLKVQLQNRGVDVTTPNQQDIAGACGRFYDATGEELPEGVEPDVWLFHLGQPEVERALAGARKYDMGEGAFTFVRKGAAAELGPLYGIVLAMLGYDVKAADEAEPDIFWGEQD